MKFRAIILAGCLAAATQAAADPVKIGAILTLSGPDATPGIQMDRGMKLYMSEHAKDLPAGVTTELIERDDTGPNPEVAKRLAQELVTRDHVQMLTGVLWTPNAAAIAPIVTEAKVPFIISNAAGVSITRMSPYIIRVSFTLWQTSFPLGQWAAKKGMGKGYSIVADYAPGNDAENGFIAGYTEGGGEMLGKTRYPLGNLNFTPYLQRMIDAKPQTAYIFVPVGDRGDDDARGRDARPRGPRHHPHRAAGPGARRADCPTWATRPWGSSPRAHTPPSPSGRRTRPSSPRGSAPTAPMRCRTSPASRGWDSMAAIYAVLKETGGKFDGDKAMAILANWKNPDSPRGPISINPATRDIVENIYIRKVEKVDGKLSNVEFETIANVKDPWKERNPPK